MTNAAVTHRSRQARLVRTALTILVVALGAIASDMTTASASLCIGFTYDGVGNRLTVTKTAPVAPTWGSASWGCMQWTPQ